jgi:hypothetical protein
MADGSFDLDESALNAQIRSIGRSRMASLQRRIANQARQDVPVKTGNLGRSVGEGVIGFSGPRTVTGSVHGGRTVFAKIVRQGPVKGRPFLRNAATRIASQEK